MGEILNGKILFGIDYLYLMRNIITTEDRKPDDKWDIINAVMKLSLLQWGLSGEEIDLADRAFWNKLDNKELEEDVRPALDRILSFVKNDPLAKERLMVDILAIEQFDDDVTERELFFANYLKEQLDLKPSEFKIYLDKGFEWGIFLKHLGKQFMKYGKTHEDL